MAVFKDPPLKQVVDDLNILNAATITGPLRVEQCELSDPQPNDDEFHNTKATLTITQPDVNFPLGSVEVRYRRLSLDTLRDGNPTTLTFTGVATQTKTLLEILQRFNPAIAAYILPELEDTGPITLSRDNTQVHLSAKEGSLILLPESLRLDVATVPVDIGTLAQKTNLTPFPTSLPFPTPGTDMKEFVMSRILLANQQTAPLPSSDFDLEIIPFPDKSYYADDLGRAIRVTVTNTDGYYSGTADFWYSMLDISAAAADITSTDGFVYTEGQTMRQVISAALAAKNRYFEDEGLYDMPMKPVRKAGSYAQYDDYSNVLSGTQSLIYGPMSRPSRALFTVAATQMYPWEEILSFQVDVASTKTLLTTTNLSTMPVTVELLEKPAEYAPTTLAVNASMTTIDTLPVGVYKIRLTRPDSYRTPMRHQGLKVLQVFKVKGHDLSNLFNGQASLTTVSAGAFDEAGACINASYLFNGCAALTSLPDHIFDAMERCHSWASCLAGTTNFKVYPAELFAFLKAFQPSFSYAFQNAGPENIPTNLFKNAHWLPLDRLFYGATNVKTIPSGFIAAMDQRLYYDTLAQMFFQCTQLTSVPADLLVGLKRAGSFGLTPYYGVWNLQEMFSKCSALVTLPGALFQPLCVDIADPALGNTLNLSYMFRETAIAAIPQGFLDNVVFPTTAGLNGTFFSCTQLTQLRGDLFRTAKIGTAMGGENIYIQDGTFARTGLTSLPADLFVGNETSLQGLSYTFSYTPLTTLPANLFAGCTALTDLNSAFFSCTQLASLPAGLFNGLTGVKRMQDVFNGCTSLTALPVGLLNNQTNLLNCAGAFTQSGVTAVPAGLFANCTALTNADSVFSQAKLAGALDNVFTNQPALTSAQAAFSYNSITSVGANVISGAPGLQMGQGLFGGNKPLTSVHADVFKYNVALNNVGGMFSGCEQLTSIPAGLLSTCPEVLQAGSFFNGCKALTTIPATLFANNKKITALDYFAQDCIAIATIPVGLFDGLTEVVSLSYLFNRCTALTAVPNQMFKDMAKARTFLSAFQDCSSLSLIGTNLFALNTTPLATVERMFQGTVITDVPDGIFFNLKNLQSLSSVFMNCPQLVTVGRLVQNTLSTAIYVDSILSGDANNFPPAVFPDFTVADNLIDSSIVVNLTAQYFGGPFARRNNWTKNITNLFGANCRIPVSPNVKNWFAGMKLQGSGQAFITKHSVPSTMVGFFTGTTTLSDYATLPAWAKS